jgi:unconventional prefoldin RPB5 interactor 1
MAASIDVDEQAARLQTTVELAAMRRLAGELQTVRASSTLVAHTLHATRSSWRPRAPRRALRAARNTPPPRAQALDEQAADVAKLRRMRGDYEQLCATLRELPARLEHPVMIPLCKNAFMPGSLRRSNEVLVLLGDNVFAERSASQAEAIAARRVQHVDARLAVAQRELANLEARTERALEVQRIAEAQADDDIVDIREPYESDVEEASDDGGEAELPPRAHDAPRAPQPAERAQTAARPHVTFALPTRAPHAASPPGEARRVEEAPKPMSKFKADRLRQRGGQQ